MAIDIYPPKFEGTQSLAVLMGFGFAEAWGLLQHVERQCPDCDQDHANIQFAHCVLIDQGRFNYRLVKDA